MFFFYLLQVPFIILTAHQKLKSKTKKLFNKNKLFFLKTLSVAEVDKQNGAENK
jgi:hypothetical protein